MMKFQSTLPARGATLSCLLVKLELIISIHAPREGSDPAKAAYFHATIYFNPRSPRGERLKRQQKKELGRYFNPRSPRGERPGVECKTSRDVYIFQSTLPARGATYARGGTRCLNAISIHAPREGSDGGTRCLDAERLVHFNPRSPRGERQYGKGVRVEAKEFQSTLPARGATDDAVACAPAVRRISIHAPREGSDIDRVDIERRVSVFQSTLPARGATAGASGLGGLWPISIHAPREGSDEGGTAYDLRANEFQSTLPARGATTAFLAAASPG